MSNPHLILVSGFAGSGKSYIGSEIARRSWGLSYLDKDTLTRALTEELLLAHGSDPHDRESEGYLTKVRPFEYKSLQELFLEFLHLGKDVLVSAPFLAEVTSADWMEELDRQLAICKAYRSVVWVKSDPVTIRERLITRGAKRDTYKLQHWEEYKASLIPAVPEGIPEGTLIFDNTAEAAAGWDARLVSLAEELGLII